MTGERPLTAFLDANALYPAELRNLLMRLALAEAYRPRWSDHVQKEWTEALARDRPDLHREKIERVRALMEQHIPEATVAGYEMLVGQLTLPDDGDRHVLAAAIGRRGNPCDRQPQAFPAAGAGAIRRRGASSR